MHDRQTLETAEYPSPQPAPLRRGGQRVPAGRVRGGRWETDSRRGDSRRTAHEARPAGTRRRNVRGVKADLRATADQAQDGVAEA